MTNSFQFDMQDDALFLLNKTELEQLVDGISHHIHHIHHFPGNFPAFSQTGFWKSLLFNNLQLAIALLISRCRCRLKDEWLMLRIQRFADDGFVVFSLSGRIEEEHVVELQRLFTLEAQNRNQSIVLDLTEVQLVAREAVRFLSGCRRDGIQLRNCPAYIRDWIDRETRSI